MNEPEIFIDIPAGETRHHPIAEQTRYFYPFMVSGSVSYSFDGVTYKPLRQSVGRIFATPPEAVYFHNDGLGAAAVLADLTADLIDDKRFNLTGTVGVKGGGDQMADPVETVVSNAAVEIAPANANRTSAIVYAGADALSLVNAGGAVGDVDDIAAGGTATVTHTGAIYAIRRTAGTVKARVREEETA